MLWVELNDAASRRPCRALDEARTAPQAPIQRPAHLVGEADALLLITDAGLGMDASLA